MKHLEYRLGDLDDASTANALFDDLSDAHPDLRALFDALRTHLHTEDIDATRNYVDDLENEVADLQNEVAGLQNEMADLKGEIARLTDDLSYQINRTHISETALIELHDATRGQAK